MWEDELTVDPNMLLSFTLFSGSLLVFLLGKSVSVTVGLIRNCLVSVAHQSSY